MDERLQGRDAFVSALNARDPSATQEQMESAADKAHRAPVLLLAVACPGDANSGIPVMEQLVSLGAAIQNLLLGAMGFGSDLTSGQAMNAVAMRELFHLDLVESAVCFVNIGAVSEHKTSKCVRLGVIASCRHWSSNACLNNRKCWRVIATSSAHQAGKLHNLNVW